MGRGVYIIYSITWAMEGTGWKWKNIRFVILYFIHFLIFHSFLSLLPQQSPYRHSKLALKLQGFLPQPHRTNAMDSFMGHIGNGLSQCHQTLQTVCQNFPVDPILVLKTTICSPIFIENIASPPLFPPLSPLLQPH